MLLKVYCLTSCSRNFYIETYIAREGLQTLVITLCFRPLNKGGGGFIVTCQTVVTWDLCFTVLSKGSRLLTRSRNMTNKGYILKINSSLVTMEIDSLSMCQYEDYLEVGKLYAKYIAVTTYRDRENRCPNVYHIF